ncbi:hypothetical protein [Alicyclobacillus acidoterrestris]|uniref:Uncharacterized protein n=1 Tax=Alicyclobacillus acidoterrestris (strain ATCC 49025 / DSM 3922 / CIP 106132 / NCIMB 13137 / GD3B) TaxID=1356854 RepID=T0BQQ0_ALIAG|nr:hypothetical protein [Alicyclobacillus acidoterrestris]EPZ46363.1 hypothetical protein N007_06790 [Alicyclobacillus acidoterrestris ATCC 49025]UNO48967.1 hypothetical protein K1I37_20700 [Alicyclobacillus acidoterrestris]
MIHESNEKSKVEIHEISTTFNEIYRKPYFPLELEEEIKKANALIIPYETFRDMDKVVFPEGTRDFFDYLKQNSSEYGVVTDICISDGDFRQLELHADVINLPEIIVTSGIFPIVTGLIVNYVTEKVKSRRTQLNVKVGIIVESNGGSKKISYEGDAEQFGPTLRSISEEIFKQ